MTRIRKKRIQNILNEIVQKKMNELHSNRVCKDGYIDSYGRDILTDKNGFCPKHKKRIAKIRESYLFENIYSFYDKEPIILSCGFTLFSSNKAWYAHATFDAARSCGCMDNNMLGKAMAIINDDKVRKFIKLCHEHHIESVSGNLIESGRKIFGGNLYNLFYNERYDDFAYLSQNTVTNREYINLERARERNKLDSEIDNILKSNAALERVMDEYAIKHKSEIEELVKLSEEVPESGVYMGG